MSQSPCFPLRMELALHPCTILTKRVLRAAGT
ncbi:hypothetical protein PF003_g8904 [Phytophthora fragariae]|nr:hypothetical protein PF003_g8904 [Phytophthora fragariae]